MSDIIKILSVIKNRLPGGNVYEEYMSCKKLKSLSNSPLEKAIVELIRKDSKNRFFLGGKKANSLKGEILYTLLCNLYTDSEDRLDFGNIKMPKAIDDAFHRTLVAGSVIFFLFPELIENEGISNFLGIHEGSYETDEVCINTGDVVLDCGANMGFFSAASSRKADIVYAFEPVDSVIENYLSKTASWNSNIIICKYAVSNKREQLQFKINTENMAAGFIDILAKTCDEITNESKLINLPTQTVEAISLDEFINENNIQRVDFIKADIEGSERYMLEGAKNILKEFAPKLSICTYHLPDDPMVLKELILHANPKYIIKEDNYMFGKLFAYIPK